jgi:hypothetical protein
LFRDFSVHIDSAVVWLSLYTSPIARLVSVAIYF